MHAKEKTNKMGNRHFCRLVVIKLSYAKKNACIHLSESRMDVGSLVLDLCMNLGISEKMKHIGEGKGKKKEIKNRKSTLFSIDDY